MELKRLRTNPSRDDFPYKVELHVHLDGAIRLSTLLDVAKRRNIKLTTSGIEELRQDVCVYHAKSLYKVLSSFEIFMPIVAGDKDAISRLAYEFCEDSARNKIKYVEARFSPQLLANNELKPEYASETGDLTPRAVVQLVTDGFKKGSTDFNIRVKAILCCMRHRPDWSDEVVNLAYEYRNDGVVAIDIAGGSNLNQGDPEYIAPGHKEAFKKAKQLGIHITAHAGEAGPATKVKESLDDLFAERIGHGYRTLQDAAVYEEVRMRKIHMEACPISSICTGAVPEDIHQHPVVTFAKDGVNFSLNSDDPLVFDTCLLDDYMAATEMGLTNQQIITAIFNAARSCFAPEEEKKQVLQELADTYGTQYL